MFRAENIGPPPNETVTMNPMHIAASAFVLATLSAAAPAADAPPAVSAEPQTTSATYGDWILRCSHNTVDGKDVRVCEVFLPFQIQAQGQSQPFGQLAIGHVVGDTKNPLHITFIVTPSVAFPSDVKIMSDDKDPQPITLNWSSCVPQACRADGDFKDDMLKRWKGLTANGKLVYKGQPVPIPVSVRGLAQALDALAKS